MKLYHKTYGEGEPFIILHGLFGSSDNWMSVAKLLPKKYHIVLADLRNHGESPHSDQWNYKLMAQDVRDLANELGVEHFHLMGHSMGGKVAMTLAAEFPGILTKLIVADIAPKSYPVRHQKIIDALLSIDLKHLESRKEAEDKLAVYIHEAGVRQFLLKNLSRDSDESYSWKLNLEVINKLLENVGEATIPQETIDTPTLFIRGSHSDYVTDDDVAEIRKYYANAKVETLGNAGHWLHAERPDAFVETVLDFLEK
ncbi:MAG: alpha/beta fold hydrolase [Cyclobacteriaceae bacterium]|nr:alpha/beta fold hydrolase [Cyclobacteriaceae bacterium]